MENPIYYVTLDLTPKCLCGNEQVSVTLQSIKDGQPLVKEYYHGFNITESCKKLQRFNGLHIAKNLFQYFQITISHDCNLPESIYSIVDIMNVSKDCIPNLLQKYFFLSINEFLFPVCNESQFLESGR